MLNVNELIGFGVGHTNLPITMSYTATGSSAAVATSWSFTSVSFGAADATRYIFVTTNVTGVFSSFITSVTAGGVSLTEVAGTNKTIWYGLVPTGTTGTVIVSASASLTGCGIGVFRVVGSPLLAVTSGFRNSLTSPSAFSAIGVGAGEALISHFSFRYQTSSALGVTWGDLTEHYDTQVDTIYRYSAASTSTPGSYTGSVAFTTDDAVNHTFVKITGT